MVTIKLNRIVDQADSRTFEVLIYLDQELVAQRVITVSANYEIAEKIENILKGCVEISSEIK